MKVLLKFDHGLGDCVQFTSVLQHLRKHRPEWEITLLTNAGKHSVGIGLCKRTTSDREIVNKEKFDKHISVNWWECHHGYEGMPSTKVERCLREEFNIQPELELLKYNQNIRQEAFFAAEAYFRAIGAKKHENGKWGICVLHYQGNTSTEKKNINHDVANIICNHAITLNHLPIILDWDKRSPLPDNKKIFCPDAKHPLWDGLGTGDAETIAALISLSNICISIDSGPGHVAGTTNTPTLIIWNKHHPIHYYAPTTNTQHLIPYNHLSFIRENQSRVFKFFNDNYRYIEYTNLANSVVEWMDNMSGQQIEEIKHDPYLRSGDFWIRRDNIEQDMVIVRDIYDNDSYRLSLIPGIIQQAKFIVDIGAHIGCFAKLVHKLNPSAKIICIEVCPENIECLKMNVGDFAEVIQAACTYEDDELMLLNAIRPNCESTGGSTVISKSEENTVKRQPDYQYWLDYRSIEKITLEQIMQRYGVHEIDLLKLDCEGTEFSILDKTTYLYQIKFILGEYHDKDRWKDLVQRKFSNWDYGRMHVHEPTGLGLFHLSNRMWPPKNQTKFIYKLLQYIKPGDSTVFYQNIPWYQCIYDICIFCNPKIVVEFGVRAGYSAKSVKIACPDCKIFGYESDIDEPSRGFWEYAQKIIPEFVIYLHDTRMVDSIPKCDLVLVDADHSYEGCLHELQLASFSCDKILVDDYGENDDIKRAVIHFLSDFKWSKHTYNYDNKEIVFLTRISS